MPITWERHNASEYLFFDCRGLSTTEISNLVLSFSERLDSLDDHSLRLIVNLSDLTITPSLFSIIKVVAKQAQQKVCKTAYIGIESKLAFKIYKKFTGSKAVRVSSMDEALAHVCSENE